MSTAPNRVNRAAPLLAVIVLAALLAAIAYGVARGAFMAELEQLVRMPWGLATLIDVYAGLALFAGWVVHRERSALRAAPWLIAMALLGNVVSGVYVRVAAARSSSDVNRFWHGR